MLEANSGLAFLRLIAKVCAVQCYNLIVGLGRIFPPLFNLRRKMLLKIIIGRGHWLLLNGNCHMIHLKLLIQKKCRLWPEQATAADLCDLETGALMGFHTLEPWHMTTSCFEEINLQRKIFTPVAMTIEKGIIQAIEPMLDQFEEKFPEANAFKSLINTKIRVHAEKSAQPKSLLLPSSAKDSRAKPKSGKKAKEKKVVKK